MKHFPSSFCEYGCILKALAFAVGNDTELQNGRGGWNVLFFSNTLKKGALS